MSGRESPSRKRRSEPRITAPGTQTFGPHNATLTVATGRSGAAAKAGHDLRIEVTEWSATVQGSERPVIELTAHPGSLKVREANGGVTPLSNRDRAKIERTIAEDVLKRAAIAFRSTAVEAAGGRFTVHGELELAGKRGPIAFELTGEAGGRLAGRATVTQTDWGIKPYSAMLGALKVRDDVEVVFEGA